jgi:uncharacterized membrane protein (DUF373 family)
MNFEWIVSSVRSATVMQNLLNVKPIVSIQSELPIDSKSLITLNQKGRHVLIVKALETIQDLIAISLCVGLFAVMVLQLREIFTSLLSTLQFHDITADILFILILMELFRLLIIYLQEQRVSIGVSVEVAIVSVLREVIVQGVLEVEWHQMLAACAFLISMAGLMVVRVWLPPTFEGVDPERQVSARMRDSHES